MQTIKMVKNFNQVKKGPVIFLGNEFFDAIPIKQFKSHKNLFLKNILLLIKIEINEKFIKASKKDKRCFKILNSQS